MVTAEARAVFGAAVRRGEHQLGRDTAEDRDRREVIDAAVHGESPRSTFSAADLARIFEEYELDELQQIAGEVSAASPAAQRADDRARRRVETEKRKQLRRETESVLREWAQQEEAKQWQKAEAEARKRLGL